MSDIVKDTALALLDSLKTAGMTDQEAHKVLGVSRACLGLGLSAGAGLALRGRLGGPKAMGLALTAGVVGGTVSCEIVARMTAAQIQDLRDTIAQW